MLLLEDFIFLEKLFFLCFIFNFIGFHIHCSSIQYHIKKTEKKFQDLKQERQLFMDKLFDLVTIIFT